MNKFSIGAKITLSFVVLLIMFIITNIVNYNNSRNMYEHSLWVEHTLEVLEKTEIFFSHLKDAETGQRGYIITGLESYLDPYQLALSRIDTDIANLKELTSDNDNQQRRIDRLNSLIKDKLAELKKTIEVRRNAGFEAARAIVVSDKGKKAMDEIRSIIEEMESEENKLLELRIQQSAESRANSTKTIIGVTIFASLFVILLSIFFIRIIAIPVKNLSLTADKIANGNLTGEILAIKQNDEIGQLFKSFRLMQDSLRQQIDEIKSGVAVLASSSSEIMASVSQLASSTAESTTSIGETTVTVEEVRQTAEVTSDKAKNVSEGATQNLESANEGNQAIEDTLAGMNKIKIQMESIANMVVRLSEQSQSIGSITETVNELAEQSNLLAVNAAIEAAKAGEHGKGFSVVAQEIKNLSDRSKESTKQVQVILKDIQKSISKAVMVTEEGSKAVVEGLSLTAKTGDIIQSLAENVESAADAAMQIAASSQQQLEGMDQITIAMENVKESSVQASAGTQQVADSAKDLQKLGENLQILVNQYKV